MPAILCRALGDSASSFPPEFASYRVLPSLVSALEYGGASAAAIIPLLLQLGKSVSPAEYPTLVLGPVLKLYGNPDRGIRMALLDSLGDYAEKLDKKMVNDKIWPHLVSDVQDEARKVRVRN
jgi:SCY1-like protein 1